MKYRARFVCTLMAMLAGPAVADYPDTSIYQLTPRITDQDGREQNLDTFRGHPVVITMFYGTCPHVCPLLISTIQKTEQALAPQDRAKLRVLMVSIDSENDTPQVLREVAERHHVDDARWKLTRASPGDVRKIAAVLGIRYRKLPNGEFNHSTVLTLLDREGVIRARTSRIPGVDEAFLRAIRDVDQAAPAAGSVRFQRAVPARPAQEITEDFELVGGIDVARKVVTKVVAQQRRQRSLVAQSRQ